MSSRLMPPKVGSSAAMISTSLSGSRLGDLDVEDVDAGELLEQDALAFHHRLGGQRADVAQAQHGGAVGDHRHQVAAGGELGRGGGIATISFAGGGDAGRIGERQVALGGQRLGRRRPRSSRVGVCDGSEARFRSVHPPSSPPRHPLTKRAANWGSPMGGNITFSIEPASLVRPRRLELPRLAALAPQASASTNSAMAAPVDAAGDTK